jgi:hypothetical protein
MSNNLGSKKRRFLVATLFAAGYGCVRRGFSGFIM